MAETKWSPGPWRVADDAAEADFSWWKESDPLCVVVTVDDAPGKGICSTNDDGIPTDEDIANAQLIAAAPDLYAALEAVLAESGDPNAATGEYDTTAGRAYRALAKARGEG